jgi:hypothetical protein
MADDGYRTALDGFIADLNRVWRAVGGPSYAQLEHLSVQVLRQRRSGEVRFVALAPSTTSEILSGRRKQPLKWPWVLTFLTVLQIAAQRGAIDAAVIGTIDEWKRKHEAVLTAGRAPLRPVGVAVAGQRNHAAHEFNGGTGPARTLALPRGTVDSATDSEADDLLGAFLTLLRRSGAPQWWHSYRDVAPEWLDLYLNLESGTEFIRTYETGVIPGLLQGEAYARAVMAQYRPDATAAELTRLVELRMHRRCLHRCRQSCMLWAIVEEAAFHNQWIDARTRRAQVSHLIDMTEDPNVALQVVPAGSGDAPTLSEPMTIFRFPDRYLGDVVCLERSDRAFFLHELKDTEHYNQLFSSLTVKALPPDITRSALRRIRDEI